MTWFYEDREFTEDDVGDAYGFVYIIRNLITDRIYIGRKYFTRASSKTVRGKRKRLRVTSDWQDYFSSSKELQEDVESLGKDNFRREILRLCFSKSECAYWEAHYQFELRVLLEDTYNGQIHVRVKKNGTLLGTSSASRRASKSDAH